MKSKAPLLMMEQLVMTLVFGLAAALCLKCFALAHEMNRRTEQQDEAVRIAQNAAELLKAGAAPEAIDEEQGYELRIAERKEAGLTTAEVAVYFEGELLFGLTTGWQEAEK